MSEPTNTGDDGFPSQEAIDKYWLDRRERHKRFVESLPKMTVEFEKPLGPYRVGDTPTVSVPTGNDYIARGYAKKVPSS